MLDRAQAGERPLMVIKTISCFLDIPIYKLYFLLRFCLKLPFFVTVAWHPAKQKYLPSNCSTVVLNTL
jgi:hypothetical protein